MADALVQDELYEQGKESKDDDADLVEEAATYLADKTYPDHCSANRKRQIKKRAEKFLLKDGELHYRNYRKRQIRVQEFCGSESSDPPLPPSVMPDVASEEDTNAPTFPDSKKANLQDKESTALHDPSGSVAMDLMHGVTFSPCTNNLENVTTTGPETMDATTCTLETTCINSKTDIATTPVVGKGKRKLTLAAERDKKKRMDNYSRLKGSKLEKFVDLTSSKDVKSSTCKDLIPADERDKNKGLEKYTRLKGRILEELVNDQTSSNDVKSLTCNEWIPDLSLTVYDKDIITKGAWLTDSIINAGMKLMKEAYPHIEGLQETALGETLTFNIL
uniref:Uncharacterized protein n=1 Tax=Amphimedon queenslandica TaxID=400682 RepID=A0A1X7U401_AMPQE